MAAQIASPVVNATGKTRLRESLERTKRGEGPSVGQWLEFPGYSLARTVAPLGEDWVLIDTEHGNIDDRDMYLQVGATSTSGVSPIVRIPASEHWMLKRALDCGAHAIMVPMCETKASYPGSEETDTPPVNTNPLSSMGYVAFELAKDLGKAGPILVVKEQEIDIGYSYLTGLDAKGQQHCLECG